MALSMERADSPVMPLTFGVIVDRRTATHECAPLVERTLSVPLRPTRFELLHGKLEKRDH
jgi:hypothetical protein